MRSIQRILLVGALVATLTVSPVTACNCVYRAYYDGGCNEAYGSACCPDCQTPCDSCCDGTPMPYAGPRDDTGMTAPTEAMPKTPQQEMPARPAPGGETLVPPAVPPTHELETPVWRRPAQPAPPTTPAEPAEPGPLSEQPATEPGGLFGPSEEPGGIEDLFGPAEETEEIEVIAPVEEPAMPSEEPAMEDMEDMEDMEEMEEPIDESPVDSLFGAPAEEETTEPAEETPPADEDKDEDVGLDDLFGQADSILREPGGLASADLRRWVDNTGRYSCRGRLIQLLEGRVRLLKDNGRTTTVPLFRLSQDDLEFVNRQANAQMAGAIVGAAQIVPMWPMN